MKKIAWILGCGLIVALAAALVTGSPRDYHLREFENIKTNFNSYRPSLSDRFQGIRDNQGKWVFHLRRLEELGVVQHQIFVFTQVPYTRDARKRISGLANSNSPKAVWWSTTYKESNAPGYGVDPYSFEVWDFPGEMERWTNFFEANNHR